MIGKHKAEYQDHPRGEKWCAKCSMYRIPRTCTLVKGDIDPHGWCRHYESRSEQRLKDKEI